jgi:cytoskeletal protein CcmA (bactofilin family)
MTRYKRISYLMVALATGLGSCGGGGGGDSSSESDASVTTVGKIDGFGSVYVNGIKFDTSQTSYEVDGEQEFDDSALGLGMVVRVEGRVSDDGTTGIAEHIEYDDDLEGPIDSGSLIKGDVYTTFTILGMAVQADINETVFDDGASYQGLAEGQELEVSGYFDGSQLVATRIELQSDGEDDFEIKGTVASYDENGIALVLQNGVIAGPYPLNDQVELEIPEDPIGLFVEVELRNRDGILEAVKIESEDSDRLEDRDDDISLEGILVVSGDQVYSIDGVEFLVSPTTVYKPSSLEGSLTAGMRLEVEGHMQGELLIAEKIESEGGEIEIEALVSSVSATDEKNGTVTLDLGGGRTLMVQFSNATYYKDDSDSDLDDDDSFNLSELMTGDAIEIEAMITTGEIIAVKAKREDELSEAEIEAPLEAYVEGSSLTLLGVTFPVDSSVEYEIDDQSVPSEQFFSELEIGRNIKLKDEGIDGVIDKVELIR